MGRPKEVEDRLRKAKWVSLLGIAIQLLLVTITTAWGVFRISSGDNIGYLFLLPAALCLYFAWDIWQGYKDLLRLDEACKELEKFMDQVQGKADNVIKMFQPEDDDEQDRRNQ